MFFFIGTFVVIGSVIGGYLMHNGKLSVLWQPSEFIIILGAAIGSFIITNPKDLQGAALKSLKKLFKPAPYNKDSYIELLTLLFNVFKVAKTKGMLELEGHIENPSESALFSKYPKFMADHHALDFLCDYLRVLTMGVDNYYQMDDLMNQELELHHKENHDVSHAIVLMGDAMPALGIVAAVLGVITTMGSITEPPEILGGLIGAALVGTFTGVLVSYGFISPMGTYIGKYGDAEAKFLECIKVGIIAHMQGNAPQITVEYIRKNIPSKYRPTFKELEEALNKPETAAAA